MVLDMMIRTPSLTSTQKVKLGQEYTDVTGAALNEWSNGKSKKIIVLDFFFNFRDIVWKGKTLTVEYDLFMMMIKQWIDDGMTKEQALDLAFEMTIV